MARIKYSFRYCVYFLLSVICFITTACAQRNPFFNLNVENGLIQSQVTAITQDRFGYLWIGTLGGLSRYDGQNFTNYTVRDGMMDNTINALTTDKNGNIWIGSTKGASRYNGKEFKHFIFQTPINTANPVFDITVADDNTVWLRAGGKLFSITDQKKRQLEIPDKNANVSAILPDEENLWIAKTGGELYYYHKKKWDSLSIKRSDTTTQYVVYSIFKDSKKQIWLGTNRGLYKIDSGRITIAKLGRETFDASISVMSITEDKNGSLWLATSNGAIRMGEGQLVFYNKHNGLTDNTINRVLTDAEGNVWLASDGRGLFRYSGTQFTVLDETMGLPSAQVMSIASMYGHLYLGTYDAGLYSYDNGEVYAVPMPQKPAIIAMSVRKHDLWLGTRGSGLWRYDGIKFNSYSTPTIASNFVSALYTDDSNRLWIGLSNGAMLYEHDQFRRLDIPNTQVQDFIEIGQDSILIATNDGIKLYHAEAVRAFRTRAAPDSAFVQCFTKRGNELWIGTSDNGLIRYDLKTKKTIIINKNNGLYSDFIYNIITDNDGNIWAGTGYGIHKITLRENTPVITFYGKGQGIYGMESNHNAVYKMRDGSLWFGTTNGALHYYPESKIIRSEPISIALRSVKIFGETITDSSYYDSTDKWNKVPYKLHLPYRKNNISFTFQAISLSGAEQLHYRYRIEGLDPQWSNWSSVNTVTYSALPPGNYVLQVECVTDNNSDIRKLSYPFEIITPFQKTGWFRLVIFGGCILLGISLQYLVNKSKQRRLALMERLRREEQSKVRMRTAEDFHDEVGNRLTRINVLTNVLQKKLGPIGPEPKRIIEQIQENTAQLYGGTRDILWSLKPSNDTLYEIIHRLRDFGGELFQDTDINFVFIGGDEKWRRYKLPMDMSRNLIMIFKEALNNCLKYSGATNVKLEAHIKDYDVFQVVLVDNGKGFDIEAVQKGHGIDNMQVRAKRINGRLYIDTWPGKGTSISLTFRLPERNA
jgi:ligand-binding sensor domain-containing protein/signal transduction histidine kinase